VSIILAVLLFFAADWWDLAGMKALLGDDAPSSRLLGYDRGPNPRDPDYSFLAANTKSGRRYLVLVKQPKVLITFAGNEETHSIKLNPPVPYKPVSSIDLAGVRFEHYVILFHTETTMARSTFFGVEAGGTLKYLVVGLVPGTWEIWRNGFLEDPEGVVNKESGILYFEGPPGNYYLKRLY